MGQLLVPALQARRLRITLLLKMHVIKLEEAVGGRARNRVHEEREVTRLRQRSLATVAHAHGQETTNTVVVRCLQDCPGTSSSEESASLAAESAGDCTRAAARHTQLQG